MPHKWVHLCFHSRALLALPPDVGSANVIVWERGFAECERVIEKALGFILILVNDKQSLNQKLELEHGR